MNDLSRLLAHLHRGGQYAYLWIMPGKRSIWTAAGNPLPVPSGRYNVYFGVHPTAAIPPENSRGEVTPPENVRAQIPYIAALNCLFAEFDAGDFGDDKDAIRAHIDRLRAPPSVLVDSGGGYHAYWLLREPLFLDSPAARERAVFVQRRWVEYADGDTGAMDLARVLRLPGTMNYKYDPPRPVMLVGCDFDRLYDLGDLERLCPSTEPRLSRRERETGSADQQAPPDEETLARIRANLARLAPWRRARYKTWLEVGMALSELGQPGLALWDTWSQGNSKYRPGVCARKWRSFKPGHGLTLASLAFWADQDDPEHAPSESTAGLRWGGRKGAQAFLHRKEMRYTVTSEGRSLRIRANASGVPRGVQVLLQQVPGFDLEKPVQEIVRALNADPERIRADLRAIPIQLARHPPDRESPPPTAPEALRDFAPWVARRLGDRPGREDKAAVSQAIRDCLLQKGRLLRDVETGSPYLLADDAQCLSLAERSLALDAALAEAGLNPSEPAFEWLRSEFRVMAHKQGRTVRVLRFFAAETGVATVYLSCGPAGYVVATPGAELACRRNGDGGLIFAREATLPAWDWTAAPVDPLSLAAFRPCITTPGEAPAYTAEVQHRLLAAWLAGLVTGVRSLPLLALLGNKGGGKTTLGRSVQRLLLGETAGLTPLMNADPRDFWTLVQERPTVGFDNVDSELPPWFTDALAMAATGGRVQKRKLYSDDAVLDRGIRAAIAITSRTAPFARADVVERLLPVFTAEFADGSRRADSELDREVAAARSGMLVFLMQRAAQALQWQQAAPRDLPARFLDFARLVWAWHAVAGCAPDAVPALFAWRAAQALAVGDADPLLAAIVEHAPPEGIDRVTPAALVKQLISSGAILPFLGGGKAIANRLRELRASLAMAGWKLTEDRLGNATVFSLVRADGSAERRSADPTALSPARAGDWEMYET